MRKLATFITFLMGIYFGFSTSGCNSTSSYDYYDYALEKRRAYVEKHREELRQASKEFWVKKLKLLESLESPWPEFGFSIRNSTQVIEKEIVEIILGTMVCREEPNEAAIKVLQLIDKQGWPLPNKGRDENAKAVAASFREFRDMLKLYSDANNVGPFDNICQFYEWAISEGIIVEGMSVEQVKAAWNGLVYFEYSGSSGYASYKATNIPQKPYVYKDPYYEDISIVSTKYTSLEDPYRERLRDFHLTFRDGKLTDIMSFPHVDY